MPYMWHCHQRNRNKPPPTTSPFLMAAWDGGAQQSLSVVAQRSPWATACCWQPETQPCLSQDGYSSQDPTQWERDGGTISPGGKWPNRGLFQALQKAPPWPSCHSHTQAFKTAQLLSHPETPPPVKAAAPPYSLQDGGVEGLAGHVGDGHGRSRVCHDVELYVVLLH